MSIRAHVRKLRPIRESYTPPVEKVQSFLKEAVSELPQEKVIDVDSLVSAEKSTDATQVYEAAGVIVGMAGSKLSGQKLSTVMSHGEFSPIAKKWIENFLKIHSNKEALDAFLNWVLLTGGAVADVHGGVFNDFIHKNIKQYYDNSPITFQTPTGEKANTADVVFVTNGRSSTLIKTLKDISKLSENKQASRVKTNSKGLVTLLDDRGKEVVSFYQVSLKKAFEKARIGRATTFINKNYAGGVSLGSPTQAAGVAQSFQTEGFFADVFSKFKDIVSGGFKNFLSWVKSKYVKIAKVIAGLVVKLSNQMIKRNRGVKSLSKVVNMTRLNESSLTTFLGEKKTPEIIVTKTLVKEFKTIENEFIKKDAVNKIHRENISLLEKLNSTYAIPGRKVPPILMLPNNNAGIIDMTTVGNEIDKVIKSKEGDIITKSDIYVALKIGMNYSANVAILSILKSIERNISQYENLSQALYAFSAEVESEVKFGNTSLPLVIVYGGTDKKAVVLGTRSDYKQDKTSELSQTGKDYDDFPVAIISVRKARAGKTEQLYNVIQFKIVSEFKEVSGKPEPIYLMFELIADQSRSFTLKIEGNKYQDKVKAMT
tara:strand:+ start:9 stop:1802 length:1794 start_codon:yes stop_codon:yes gene_type:complete